MMDESFLPLSSIIMKLSMVNSNCIDFTEGVHTYITHLDINMPTELDIKSDDSGNIEIGSTPPLYNLDTSFKPSYHRIQFTLEQNIIEDEY